MSISQPATSVRLFRMRLQQEPDVVLCRNRAKLVAEKFGFDRQDQIRIATAVSEIARNAFRYAREAAAEFLLESVDKNSAHRNPQRLVCVIRDQGPGIPNLEEVLAGRYKSTTGMGMGITGAHRLMDTVKVETGPAGTIVRLGKELPRGKNILPADLQSIVDSVAGPRRSNPVEELAFQNHEILYMMEQVGEKSEELTRINDELSETNRGVVALYDELDTIYRVGHVLASKLELDDLLQALIDATTEISGAEIGIFVYEEGDPDGKLRQHTAGILAPEVRPGEAFAIHRLMGTFSPAPALLRIDDLELESRVQSPLQGAIILRSYLAVPVILSAGTLTGAMVFAHRAPAVFSERSERILSSVALQASIGIENARLYKSVRSASAAKDEFLAILSHELRNPLNPIFARLSLLEENPKMPVEALDDIRLIRRNLELETRLIDDLLDMTRISRGKILISKEPVDLHEIIEAASHACSGYAADEGVTVELELEAPAFAVLGDAVRLQQVFWNLINNAVKFSPAGGNVRVSTRGLNGERIRITVSDHGRGITPGRTEAIFQPFEQDEENAAESFGGLGLGLSICRNIITAHSGEISARSEGVGKGAVFTISLGLTRESVNRETPPKTAPVPDTGPRKLDILLVDDHLDTRSSFKSLLERRGHRVVMAGSVAEARLEAEKAEFHLLISDIGLPDASGYDLMRALTKYPAMKGIAVSGYGMKEDIARSKDAGFSLHLTKPLRIADLEKAIAEVMNPGPKENR
ncbi:MAG: ATP-binding protein [Verrucomicrobiota bacterium]